MRALRKRGMRNQRKEFLDRCDTFRLSRARLVCSVETVVGSDI
jgi:hypothetical protein